MNKNEIFDEAIRIDKMIQYLANYEVTGGNIIYPTTQEEVDELNIKISNKFNYFKKLIRSGECTLEFLSVNVLYKNGPFVQSKKKNIDDIYEDIVGKNLNESDKSLVDKLVAASKKSKKRKKMNKSDIDLIKKIISDVDDNK